VASSYYIEAKRESFSRNNPDLKYGQVTKKLREIWKATPGKQKYRTLAFLDRKRYIQEYKEYEKKKKMRNRKKKKNKRKERRG